ncbi:MAG: peptide deformylase [Planctomycetota bacterium]
MNIVTYPDPVLLKRTMPVDAVDDAMRATLRQMFELMYAQKGVGLAAPQVGLSLRLFVLNPSDTKQTERVLVNPRILKRRERVRGDEGCLSFPGIYIEVERSRVIEIEARNENFEPIRFEARDFEARIIQHELDHLDNVLLIHRMSDTDKIRLRGALRELEEKYRQPVA